jgi:hypothetical protein
MLLPTIQTIAFAAICRLWTTVVCTSSHHEPPLTDVDQMKANFLCLTMLKSDQRLSSITMLL